MLKCPVCGTSSAGETNFCVKCGYALQGATGRLDPDTLLGNRYAVMGLLGRGGMGAVYKAMDLRLDNILVAIKEMSTAALGPGKVENALEAFKREASMLIELRHPSLPRVTDFFSAGGDRWYLVMDYIEGETLEAVVRRQGRVPEKELINWTLQLCAVLGYLHEREPPVIFRDVKPANIMLTAGNKIKLIDFGIARHFNPGAASDTVYFASLGFAPPEQFGSDQTDHRSDIFSLGVTLHYLLTGIDPAGNPFNFEPPENKAVVSEGFSRLIMQMLELDPEARPQRVAEITNKLLQVRAGAGGGSSAAAVIPAQEAVSPAGTELVSAGNAASVAASQKIDVNGQSAETCKMANGKSRFMRTNQADRRLKLFVIFVVAALLVMAVLWYMASSSREGSTMPPEVYKEYYPDGPDDCGFYTDTGMFIDWHTDIKQVREIMGEPQREMEMHDDYYGDGIDIYYPGLYLVFRPDGFNSDLELIYFSITSPACAGPRGVKVGDTVESVLQRFPHEDVEQTVIDDFTSRGITGRNVRLFCHALVEADECTCHTYGLTHHADDTGDISKIELVFGILNSGFFIASYFEIESGLVTEICFNGYLN